MAFGQWATQNFDPAISMTGYQKHRHLWNLMAFSSMPKEKIAHPELGDYWFNDIQVVTARHKDLFFAAHGGHNAESHNHNDVGDFVYYAKGEPIIIDAAEETIRPGLFLRSVIHYGLLNLNTITYHS